MMLAGEVVKWPAVLRRLVRSLSTITCGGRIKISCGLVTIKVLPSPVVLASHRITGDLWPSPTANPIAPSLSWAVLTSLNF